MMTNRDIEVVHMMAKAWKMNDERNKRLAEESANHAEKLLKEGLPKNE
jgi:hypothetical protein